MESAPFVSKSVLPGGELTEVLRSLRNVLIEEPEDDATSGLAVDGDIELPFTGHNTNRKIGI